ncbi:MAG TPA: PepSY domain-containing protein [Woeseiaceae bacterium]|nr:PepSY domain-containing protein [Woeseiaceae bacterium]
MTTTRIAARSAVAALALAVGGVACAETPAVVDDDARPASIENPASTTTITEADVSNVLREAGYDNVHDIEYLDDRGVWKAEADDATGEDFEVHVDGTTGEIVHLEDD